MRGSTPRAPPAGKPESFGTESHVAKVKAVVEAAPEAPQFIRIKNTKPKGIDLIGVAGFDSKTLIPGGNNVPLGHMSALKEHAPTRWYFDQGWLVVEASGEGEPEGPEAPRSLAGYENPEAAKALIAVETDMGVLKIWHANEVRSEVQEAIGKRMSSLKVG